MDVYQRALQIRPPPNWKKKKKITMHQLLF